MLKQEFLDALKSRLAGLPQKEVEERLDFYSEMIDDKLEENISEEDAVAEMGPIEDIASQIIGDIPFSKIIKEKARSYSYNRIDKIMGAIKETRTSLKSNVNPELVFEIMLAQFK